MPQNNHVVHKAESNITAHLGRDFIKHPKNFPPNGSFDISQWGGCAAAGGRGQSRDWPLDGRELYAGVSEVNLAGRLVPRGIRVKQIGIWLYIQILYGYYTDYVEPVLYGRVVIRVIFYVSALVTLLWNMWRITIILWYKIENILIYVGI